MTIERITADLAIIGAGSGGLSVAAGAAQLGLKVVLFEKGEMGGDCLNFGCVPSKALIAAASDAHAMRAGGARGVSSTGVEIRFADVVAHVTRTIATIAPIDSQERFEGLGVRVVREAARFESHDTVVSASLTVKARKIVIATGSTAAIPPIPGLASISFLTNETVFSLTELPERLLVIGGGPIGMELGQAFQRLGSEVVIIDAAAPLGREDSDASSAVVQQLIADGVELHANARVVAVEAGPEIVIEIAGEQKRLRGSHLLVALGRKPSIGSLALEKAGVAFDEKGIRTDKSLRSTNKRVYAVGDAAGRGQFTHLAGAHASLVVRRAIFGLPVNADRMVVPRVTYTDPEIASIGLSETQAREKHGSNVRAITLPFAENDRAQAEGDTRGFARLVTSSKGKILGATLVGRHAGDHIHFWSLVMSANVKLSKITGAVMPYPTRGEINKRLAGLWYVDALFSKRTRWLVSFLKHIA